MDYQQGFFAVVIVVVLISYLSFRHC